MEFVHKPYQPGETIAAIATPPGVGGIAIVRISGEKAIALASHLFSGPVETYESHTVHFGNVRDGEGKKIDEALLLVMRGKRSFTGEETVEIQCHGGTIAAKKVLDAALKAGARLAYPGEFSLKAFMNGKLDLAQAESIASLIGAKSERAFSLASRFLEGKLSQLIHQFQGDVTTIAAIIEAWIDFPEEGLEFATLEELLFGLEEIKKRLNALLETFEEGKRAEQGIQLCITGAPNVGKSSLMNALLQRERAIVTPLAGTTRDVLEEAVTLNGLHFCLVDTAGIRETEDVIEKEGIRRSKKALLEADLILLILDASRPLTAEEQTFIATYPMEKTIALWNKCDLASPPRSLPLHTVTLSAKTGEGLLLLKQKIEEILWKNGPPDQEEVLLTRVRHKKALENTVECLERVSAKLQEGVSPEFLAADLREALFELGTIIGTNVTEEILTSIFSQFCIGK